MIVEQIYTGCLAQGAYYIQSAGEVAIIDPLREVQPYIAKAERNGAKIKYIFETHFHADFVSGHLDLSRQTDAKIVYGPNANPSFDCIIATDNQVFQVGKVSIKVLHTPGHTMESSCYLLIDENGHEHCLFSGDTLFIGDVGRPDLAQKLGSITTKDLAGFLYDSLRNKIMTLSDDLIIYPAHGAGSACGKNMSKETFDTLGNQKATNYALKEQTKEDFIAAVTDGLLPPPYYFPKNVMMNKTGIKSIDDIVNNVQALSPEAFEAAANETGALVIDTRTAQVFKDAFIPNAINIGIKGDFAPWIGTLVTDIEQEILFVAEEENIDEVITRLSRVGYDNVIGYLSGGIKAWIEAGKETDSIESISATAFAKRFEEAEGKLVVKDVRKQTEYTAEHVDEAMNIPLAVLSDNMAEFSKTETNYIHCAGGYRSMMASSILKARGFDNVVDIAGGFAEIAKTSVPKTDFVCPSKLK
ncbi:rhodanese-like domain-containing protein [Arcicella rosea]|uniref:Glyoxylase-like metal-dependent hydrolase (Beta-lactamase superfamily II)/rhodanese-related sulfurtransferase n=1 Tax=Arcicella rosea TaxID=502909 RepID=A0A841EPJ5_9BACT|nr:MBL fold metallo-hydrolase [Arcicella rosea]MBB6002648.1 glyoxylase-like metal-dependent hydrolase (beta-lactamase superfamily II)/rhodanese-related sulfurtransferase [Arcicella rosea]